MFRAVVDPKELVQPGDLEDLVNLRVDAREYQLASTLIDLPAPAPERKEPRTWLRIRNLSATAVTARLPSGIAGTGGAVTIRPGAASAVLTVTPQRQAVYFEYDVTAGSQYAEGGSKPGGFVDP